jgi:glycosyltransferase involved in cell wall biosynthesis
MRIALVHRDLHAVTRGGICTIYHQLAERYVAAGHQVTLITQDSPGPLRVPGADTVTLPRTEHHDQHRRRVADTVTALGVDIAECSSWEAELLDYLDTPNRCPVVVRGDISARTLRAGPGHIDPEIALLHRADRVIAVSRYAARDLNDAYHIPAPAVIANGVDTARYNPGPVTAPSTGRLVTLSTTGAVATARPLTSATAPEPWNRTSGLPALVWVGKITPMKGWDRLIRLVADLADTVTITVVLGHAPALCPVGDTSRLTIVQDLAAHDLIGAYRAADWLLSTSRWEGFGLAIAEAIACGTPVLVPAALGTAPELLATGAGIAYGDTDEIRDALTGPVPAAHLPAQFDWDLNARQSLALYQELVAS